MGKLLVNKIREINPLAKRGTLFLLALLASLACLLRPRHFEAAVDRNGSWAKVGMVTLCALVFSMFLGGGWFNPGQLQAAIAPVSGNSWSNIYNNQAGANPGTVAYTANPGSNAKRLLVVAVSTTTAAAGSQTLSITYGTRSMQSVRADGGTTQSHSFLFYLNEADLDLASNSNLVFTFGGATASLTNVYAAVFDGVDQTTPIAGNSGNTATTNVILTTALAVAANELAVEVVSMGRTASATARTITAPAAGWATDITNAPISLANGTTLSLNSYILSDTTAGSTTAAHTISSATAALYSMSAMRINPYVSAIPATTAGTATAVNGGLTMINVSAPYTDDSNADNTLLVEYKLSTDSIYTTWTGSALPHSDTPYTVSITGLTTGLSYDVRVTYQDVTDGVSGTAVQTISGVTTAAIPVQATFYMARNTTTNLIADGTCNITGLTPYTVTGIGKTTAEFAEFGTASRYYPTTVGGTSRTILNVYSPQYTTNAIDVANISASIAFRGNAATDTIKLDLYSYDPDGAANNGTLVASSTAITVTGGATLTRYTWTPANFTINGSGRVDQGHRLQFRLTQYSATTTSTSRLYFGVAGATASTNFTVTQTPVAGNNSTTAETATATSAGTTSISVTAPYTNDGNTNNTLRIEYKLTAAPDTSYVKWTGSDLLHAASPYTAVITGLTKGSSYAVRVTYLDADGVSGTAVQTITGVIPAVVPVQTTYYMTRDTATNLSADGISNITGTIPYTVAAGQIGKTTALTGEFGTASRYYPTTTAGISRTILNVYTPEYTTNAVDMSGISASIAFRGNAATDTIKLDLYDYDPAGAAGNGTLVASSAAKTVTGGATLTRYIWAPGDFTINGTGTVALNHRLQFRLTQYSATTTSTSRLYFGVAGNTASTNFTVTQTPVVGANLTTAGTATASAAGATRISVSAPYTDDGNANNTLRVEYKLTAAPDTSYVKWTGSDLQHSDTPYVVQIAGLNATTSYDVRVTYLDAVDGVSGTAVQVISGILTPEPGVEAYQNWTRVINDSTSHTTGIPVNLSGNFSVTTPAGTNRLLVVAITQANRALNTAPATPSTITYGGVVLKLATSNRATSSRAHTWLYYLKDNAVMDGASRQVVVNWSAGVASTKIDVACAVYIGVDQIPANYTTGTQIVATAATTAMALNVAMPVIAKAKAIYVLNVANVTNITFPTYTTNANWTTPSSAAPTTYTGNVGSNYSYSIQLAQRSIPATDTTDAATTGVRNVTSYHAMSAMVLPPVAVSVTTGAATPNLNVYADDINKVADAFTLIGSGLVSNIQITGNANTTSSNISAIRIYRKGDSNTTVYSSGIDTLVGSGTFVAVGTTPVNIAVSEAISGNTNYIIVYDIAAGAVANGTSITFTGAVTAMTPAVGSLTDTGATFTLLPTMAVGNGVEPPAVRLWKSSPATNLDAFTLVHNGAVTDDDAITNITVTLTPQYISGGSGGTITKFKLVEVVGTACPSGVCGSLNLATTGDIWNIPTTGLIATSTPATYYIRVSTADVITPSVADTSGTLLGFYSPITGRVTSLIHSTPYNKVTLNDDASASLSIDVEKPNGPATATATTGANPGQVNLVWDPVSDGSGGSLAVNSVVIRRSVGDGVSPDPGCLGLTDGSTDLSTAPGVTINYVARSVTDNGLTSDNPTRYYYRVCAKDALGNMSNGAQTYANAGVQNICNRPPNVTLAYEDGSTTSSMQLIKSAGSAPFKLQISNNDIGTCPDVAFNVVLANVVGNDSHFSKTIGGGNFPGTIILGTGGAGASTGKTVNVIITGIDSAGVQQLEQYKFGVTVSSPGDSHGAPITTASVTGLLNDMPPIVHNSANMAKYQYGSWGQTYTCATCHSNSTTNIKGVYQIISTPIGRRNVVFTKTSSSVADSDGVFGNDQRANKDVSNNVCSVCHHRTRQHQYSASKLLGGPDGDETYNPDHANSSDCVKCHTHNTAFKSIYGLCGDCHGFKATGYSPINKTTMVKDLTNALGPNPPNYGAHARHNAAKMTCAVCHSNTNHGLDTTVWFGDNILEIGFNTNKNTYPGFNPDASVVGGKFYGTNNLNQPFYWLAGPFTNISTIADYNNSCSTYCHGGGSWKAGGNIGSNTTPIWVGTGQAVCGTCHNATAAVPPTSGSHAKHTANFGAGLGIGCIKCHATYANYTGSAHINGKVEWDMSAYPNSKYGLSIEGDTGAIAPTSSGSYTTCSTLYCHSNVQGATGNGTGGPTTWGTPTWGGTTGCGSCHVQPNDTGSHASHINLEVAFDCHVCHKNGGTTSPLNHANNTIDLFFDGLAENTVYSRGNSVAPGTAYGTCSTSKCHGNFTRAWGTPDSGLVMCDKCHGSATSPGGFYGTQGPTGTLSVYSTAVGVHDIHIQNLNSPRKATFSRYTSFAKGFDCRQCHINPTGPFSSGHINTALPAEVPFNNSSSIARTGTLFGYYSSPKYTKATGTCSSIWCHGAGMYSNEAMGRYSSIAIPVRSNPVWNAPFLTGNGSTDCSACHSTPPPAPDSSYTHYGKTLTTCKDCHTHVSNDGHGFKNKSLHVNGIIEGNCNNCHGSPPINNIPGDKDGLVAPPLNALNGGAGAHNAHQLLPVIGNNCFACHNNYTAEMPSTELEIGFGSLAGNPINGILTVYSSSEGSIHWKSTTAGTTIVKTPDPGVICSNLYCHGGGTATLPVLGGGNRTTPDWEGVTDCGDCHGIDSGSTPSGGSHTRHAQLIPSLSCQTCHGTTSDNGTHVDASVSWNLQRTDALIGPLAKYNNLSAGSLPGLAPRSNGADYRNCSNFYCHSNVQSANGAGAPTVYTSPKWGNNGTMNCSSCHINAAVDAPAGDSHVKHANTTSGMGISCGYCHQDAGFGYALHTDGSVFVNFTSYIGGAYSVGTFLSGGMNKIAGSGAYGSCSATFCHGDAPSPNWGTAGTLACNACHSAKVDDVSWSGRHKTHYNYSTMPLVYSDTVRDLSTANKYVYNCAHCHDDNIAKHSLKPASADSAARVFFGISSATPATSSKRGLYVAGTPQGATDNGFNFTNGSCNTSYCHSNGRGGAPLNATLNWTTTPTGGSNCLYCHDGKSATATATVLSGKHDKHMNPLNNAMMGTGNGFNCVDCHAATITNVNNTTIANKGKHANAMLDYSGAKAKKNYSAGQCSYCHSNGNPNALVFINMTGSKVWTSATGAITTCNKCHGRSNALGYPDYANTVANDPKSNLHAGHLAGMANTTACADCHRKTGDATTIDKFRAYSTLHLNGLPNVNFNTAKTYIGTKANVVTAGNQVTCSTVVCHGQGAPVWGSQPSGLAGVRTCTKCHGTRTSTDYLTNYSSALIAPGYNGEGTDTTMTKAAPTDARVGAHQRHLTSNVLSAPVKCGECHVTVTAIRSANHWNYSTATLTFNGRAKANAHTPSVLRTGGIMQCSNVNCHTGGIYNSGTTIAPFWNMTGMVKETGITVGDCVKCHAMPPSAVPSHPAALSNAAALSTIVASCQSCHTNVSSSASNVGNAFGSKALHVNGITEVTLNCNSCHDYDTTGGGTAWGTSNYGGTAGMEGRGAHVKHIEYLKARNPTLPLLPTDTWASASYIAICGPCHSTNSGTDHSVSTPTNPRSITFGGSTVRQFGASAPFYNGSTASTATKKSSALKPKSCSNIDCHYRTSPIWSTY